MRTAILILLLITQIALVSAEECARFEAQTLDEFSNSIDEVDALFEDCDVRLPGYIRMITGSSPALEVDDERFVFTIDGGSVSGVSEEGNASVTLSMSTSAFEDVLQADDRGTAALAAYDSGAVTIDAKHPIRRAVISIVTPLLSLFT